MREKSEICKITAIVGWAMELIFGIGLAYAELHGLKDISDIMAVLTVLGIIISTASVVAGGIFFRREREALYNLYKDYILEKEIKFANVLKIENKEQMPIWNLAFTKRFWGQGHFLMRIISSKRRMRYGDLYLYDYDNAYKRNDSEATTHPYEHQIEKLHGAYLIIEYKDGFKTEWTLWNKKWAQDRNMIDSDMTKQGFVTESDKILKIFHTAGTYDKNEYEKIRQIYSRLNFITAVNDMDVVVCAKDKWIYAFIDADAPIKFNPDETMKLIDEMKNI